ncbi:MAG: hypothetical protein WCO44_07555 [Bacteroidota bacterium]
MQNIDTLTGLREAITRLEQRRAAEKQVLNADLMTLFETLQPVNMLRDFVQGGTASQEGKGSLLYTMVGLTAGYLARKVVAGMTKSPFRRLAGDAVLVSVTNAIENHPDLVVSAGRAILGLFRRKQLPGSPVSGRT